MKSSPPEQTDPSRPPAEPRGRRRARRWTWWAAGLALALLGAGLAWWGMRPPAPQPPQITSLRPAALPPSTLAEIPDAAFTDITAESGVSFVHENGAYGDKLLPESMGGGVAFFDFDNDGDQDLLFINATSWPWKTAGDRKPSTMALYRNDGQGRFSDVSASSGMQVTNPATSRPVAKSLAVAPVDVDNDGWMDLVVANDTVQNFLFRNQHDGTFQEIGSRSGIAFDAYGMARGAMGIDAARFRNDDTLGVAIGNFANEMNALYVSQRDALLFADEAITEGVGPASRSLLKFGLFFFDYDLDGRLDVLTTNGHLEEQIHQLQPGQQYRHPAQLFWNRGARRGVS